MGLYREFEVTDGVIHGCPGLEPFAEMRNTSIIKTIWSKGEDNWNGEPRCEKQRLEEPAQGSHSTPSLTSTLTTSLPG